MMLTWKIVVLAEASVLYIYIYIDNNNNNNNNKQKNKGTYSNVWQIVTTVLYKI